MNVKQKNCLAVGFAVAVILTVATIPAGDNAIAEESTVGETTTVIETTTAAEIATETTISKRIETTEIEFKSLGVYRLTAYCACEKCCGKWAQDRPTDKEKKTIVYGASGERLKAGRSVAVDPSVIPFGTRLIINGKEYIAQDSGSGIKGKSIDIYFENHEEAKQFGVQYMEVFFA